MGNNIVWPLEAVARLGAGASGGESADTSETFAADTTGAPVTVTLPALDGLEDGYMVRVYDSGSNAATNNITINDADDVELDVIAEDDGERWLVVVGGAWEVRGYLPVGSSWSPTYALEYAISQGALVSGSELSVHHLNCSDPADAIITSLSVSGVAFVDPPSASVRGARSTTNAFGGGPLVMNPAGPTAPNVDRAFELVFKLTASRTQSYVALGQWGTFSTNECLGMVRASGTTGQAIDFQAGAGNAAGTGNTLRLWDDTSLIQNAWCYVVGNYDAAAGQYTLYWWADGDGAFSSGTLAFANAGTGTAQPIYAGGNGASFYSWPAHYSWIALHNAQLTEAYRETMRVALGLT